jgi:hypothetical protein
MTLDKLKEIFKHQTTLTEDYTPTGTLEYVLIDSLAQSKIKGSHSAKDFEGLLTLLNGFEFDAFFDRTPVFIKPETIVVL